MKKREKTRLPVSNGGRALRLGTSQNVVLDLANVHYIGVENHEDVTKIVVFSPAGRLSVDYPREFAEVGKKDANDALVAFWAFLSKRGRVAG